MKLTVLFLFMCLVSSSLGNPSDHALSLRQRRDIDFGSNIQILVRELIANLQNAAKKAIYAVTTFSEGLQTQGKLFSEKMLNDINAMRTRVESAMKSFSDRFIGAGTAVRECVDSFRKEAENIYVDTVSKSKLCAEERIQDVKEMIESLKLLAENATEYANNAVEELRHCNDNNVGFLSTGACLGGVAVRTELKGASFMTQSGLSIARINLSLATLPAAFEVCAGSRMVAAGISSGKVVVEVGTCSTSSMISSLTGKTSM